ncbi:MAG TPA: right-handed parallel beta-helix repeat-containing protein [Pyrinomonadaceae bacterium]|nr:right-handed parallel beta-helix repeat-containing protein [Pyrinomonadaceae bacterium]
MKTTHFSIRFAFTFAFLLICCFTAQAQSRVFVSGVGSDTNPCTRTAPCRTFQQAHNVVSSGGEVVALDPAGFGQLTITKSISIIGDGVYSGISASSGNGVTIATTSITVTLRSLIIDGLGSGTNGISATDFSVLHIENCIVNGFTDIGIRVDPSAVGTRKVFIKDSISRNNGSRGISLSNGSGTALLATVEGTRTENNVSIGLVVNGSGSRVTARGCLSSGNSTVGFMSFSGVLNIESSVASNNGEDGIATFSGTVRVSTSTATNNTLFGFTNSGGGTFESRGNNTVVGNNGGGAQTFGTITPIAGT